MIFVFYGITLLPFTLSWHHKEWYSYQKVYNSALNANIYIYMYFEVYMYEIILYRQFYLSRIWIRDRTIMKHANYCASAAIIRDPRWQYCMVPETCQENSCLRKNMYDNAVQMIDMEKSWFFVSMNMDMFSYVCYSKLPSSKKFFASFSEKELHISDW